MEQKDAKPLQFDFLPLTVSMEILGVGQPKIQLERVMRFELTTLCLGSKYSTTELHPQVEFHYMQ